jgi:hypothetical protein
MIRVAGAFTDTRDADTPFLSLARGAEVFQMLHKQTGTQ